jgi:protein O-GlcNAc transferase
MNDAATWHRLGLAALRSGNLQAAVDALQHAVEGQPSQPAAWLNLGAALRSAGRPAEALRCYDRALALAPALPEAHNNRANALVDLARFEEALASCDRALGLRPAYPDALNNRAIVLCRLKRPQEALASLDRALALQPQSASAYANRAAALIDCDRPEEALADSERALRLDERQVDARNNRGLALQRLGRFAEALDSLDQALRLGPGYAEAHVNRGNVLRELGRPEEGLASIDRGLQLQPDLLGGVNDRARLLADLGRHEEAASGFTRVVERAPDFELAAGHLLHCRLHGCDWTDYDASVTRLLGAVESGAFAAAPLWCLALTDSAALQLKCARTFARRQVRRGVVPLPPPAAPESAPAPAARLRVAYLSSDFREHAVSRLLAGIFEQHDRARFEIIGISLSAPDHSDLGRRVCAAFDRREEASRLADADIAALIRRLEVDVLVDLNGWTRDMRPGVLARRPAPVQVSYLGYPGTSGADYVDYLIADDFVVPQAMSGCYSERVVSLPGVFQANDDRRAAGTAAPARATVALPENAIVLGSFSRASKLTPLLFDVWCRFLRANRDSVLWLVADGDTAQRNLLSEAARRGVEPDRLLFAPRLTYSEHLARIPLADLALDTFPFNGGATTSDVLWAGVPVLTCAGEAFASRMTGSLLRALDLSELITRDLDEYARVGLALLQRPQGLRALRSKVVANLKMTRAFDSRAKCRELEAAYEQMSRKAR